MSPILIEEASTLTPSAPLTPQAVAPSHTSDGPSQLEKKLNTKPHKGGIFAFAAIGVIGVVYVVSKLVADLSVVHAASVYPYVLLGVALVTALGFEFVNGFHDTANAVATVIYTHSLEPRIAVVYSGVMNFVGVLMSSGAVAFSIVALLPVELILKAGKGTGFSMIFALLVSGAAGFELAYDDRVGDWRGDSEPAAEPA
jgi:inorganic phosphate transporter, PiT family